MDYPADLQRKAEDARDAWERLLVGYTPVRDRMAAHVAYKAAQQEFVRALAEYNRPTR